MGRVEFRGRCRMAQKITHEILDGPNVQLLTYALFDPDPFQRGERRTVNFKMRIPATSSSVNLWYEAQILGVVRKGRDQWEVSGLIHDDVEWQAFTAPYSTKTRKGQLTYYR